MYGRTNDEQRFSPLSQINEQNISQLGLLWDREPGTTRGLEATPLVSNGVIFTKVSGVSRLRWTQKLAKSCGPLIPTFPVHALKRLQPSNIQSCHIL